MADHVTHRLDHCLRTAYFLFHGDCYQQNDSVTMGSPVAPVVAIVCIEKFEDLVVRTKQAPRI